MSGKISLIAILLFFVAAIASAADSPLPVGTPSLTARLPLCFIENRGQVPGEDVCFYVKGSDRTLYFTPDGLTTVLQGKEGDAHRRWTVTLDFVGANPVEPVGEDRLSSVFSYFKGDPVDWKAGVPSFGGIVYRDLWPGIDLVYSVEANRLKYEFLVRKGADPNRIRFSYRGATDLSIRDTGELVVATGIRSFVDDRPFAFQEVEAERKEVPVRYVLEAGPETDGFRYGFRVGAFDPEIPLIIDPGLLVYCGFIGGSDQDFGEAIAVDGQGNAYVTGRTLSDETSFPVTVGPDLTSNGGSYDAFVAKVDAQGTGIVYCGYVGGNDWDAATAIAVDDNGCAVIAGYTHSDETSFPVVVGPDLTYNGDGDAFVAKVSAAGTHLDFCGYIGGVAVDRAMDVVVDSSGRAYVTGETRSDESSFPVSGGPDLTHNGSSYDAFVARVDPQGTRLEYCGYIGGRGTDHGRGIAVDDMGIAYVSGETESDETSFPVTVGPDLTYNGSTYDVFVARVSALGTYLEYCGYIGGDDRDQAGGIAVDGQGRAIVTGETGSTQATFPVGIGPDLIFGGGTDAFVARVDARGTGLEYCGYIGGHSTDRGVDVAVDGNGNAHVAGSTRSNQKSFPVRLGPDLTHNGDEDAFVAKVSATGSDLDYCGYIGGEDGEVCEGIALDSAGNAYLCGWTGSSELTFPVLVGPELTFDGFFDVFVAKVPGSYDLIAADIKANGSDGPVTVAQGASLQLEIALDPGSFASLDADWWLIARSPFGVFRYSVVQGSWKPGLGTTYQGRLFLLKPFQVFSGTGMPAGSYDFFFGVDLVKNGTLDLDNAFLDLVEVTVQ